MSTSRTIAAAAVLVLSTLVAPTSVARADGPATPAAGAPVTRADRVTVAADSAADIDVLANDVDPDDATGQDLAICRVELPADSPLNVYESVSYDDTDYDTGGHPVLGVFPYHAKPGTYTVSYYVCDYDYLTPATLTVKIIAAQNPSAEVLAARPGYVRFHNPGQRRTTIQYGSTNGRTVDGKLALPPHTAQTVRVERHAILWTATIRTRHGASSSGSILRGIKQPERRSRPTPVRAIDRTLADRTAWRLGTQQVELRSRQGSPQRPSRVSRTTVSRDESTEAPVTAPDTSEVSQGWFGLTDVLTNDSDPDGAGSDLAICRASAPADSGLQVTPLVGRDGVIIFTIVSRRSPGTAATAAGAAAAPVDPTPYSLLVQADSRTPRGTYEITYYACDHQYLTPGTATVTVTRSQAITARKVPSRPGVVRFTNPGPHAANVRVRDLGDIQEPHQRMPLIARFELPAHTSKTLRPHARQILWSATSRRGPGGAGIVSGIRRSPRG